MIKQLDPERIAQAIELTRFPIPDGDDYADDRAASRRWSVPPT